jgi:hypothetical protein
MSLLKLVWNDLRKGENFDSYLIILAAFVVVFLDLFQVPVGNYITPITLGILGLLAISNLGNRHRIEELLKRSRQSTGFIFLDEFSKELNDDFETARDVMMIGITFTRTMRTY